MLPKMERINQSEKEPPVIAVILLLLALMNGAVLELAFVYHSKWYITLFITLPLLFAAIFLNKQKKQNGLENRPSNDKVVENITGRKSGTKYNQALFELSRDAMKYLN